MIFGPNYLALNTTTIILHICRYIVLEQELTHSHILHPLRGTFLALLDKFTKKAS